MAFVDDKKSKSSRSSASRKPKRVITRHGKPAGVLIRFESEDDWFEYRLENDPRFLRRVSEARAAISSGHGIPLEAV